MTEPRNTEHDLARFRIRVLAAALFVFFAFGLLVARLVYCRSASTRSSRRRPRTTASRSCRWCRTAGSILDRKGVVLANNYSAYTLEIQPAKVADLDATIDKLAEVVDIQPRTGGASSA